MTGTPQLTLELGGGQRTATYEGGSGTAALVFGYTVAAGESDTDGVGVEADSLSGGTIRDGAGHNAVLDHQAVAANASHKVDGVKPALAATGGAVVDGTTLTLTYDEALDGSSTPAPGDFTVSGGDRARAVTGVRVNGSAVEADPGCGGRARGGRDPGELYAGGQPDPGCAGKRGGGAQPRAGDQRHPGHDLTDGEQSGHHLEPRI